MSRSEHSVSIRQARDRSRSAHRVPHRRRMSTLAARLARPRTAAIASRLYGALPLLTLFAWLCLIFGWEAWGNLSPWLLGDDLQRTHLARATAETRHDARRRVPV